ncbi:MAG: CYTH domain-containing protein [Cryomorphaceae bacterium]|nr:CYTH domain-containing protein [Cryomorphaceae bacterium]
MTDHFEIEKKYLLDKDELRKVEKRLKDMHFVSVSTRHLSDHFIPGTRKGELLRVRQEGNHHFALTFKENVVIDGRQSRRESEPDIHAIAAHLIIEAASHELGEPLPTLYKVRRDFKREWEGFVAHVVIDYVPELKDTYGAHFLEVEIIVDDAGDISQAKQCIKEIAEELFGEERKPCKKSYRRMLFKTLKKKGRFPKRWFKLTGHDTSCLDPRDTGSVGISRRSRTIAK